MNTLRWIAVCTSIALSLSAALGGQAQGTDRRFESSLGFSFTYPTRWSANLAGDFPLLTAADLDPRVRSHPEARLATCNQKIFFAKLGQPSANLIVGVLPTECLGKAPDMELFEGRTRTQFFADYHAQPLEEAEYNVGIHHFWAVRGQGMSRVDGQRLSIELVATLLPRGIVYWRIESPHGLGMADFEQIRLSIGSSAAAALLSASAQFRATIPQAPGTVQPPAPPPAVVAAIHEALKPDATASHHYESQFGFSLDVPEPMAMLNPNNFDALLHLVESQHGPVVADASTAPCSQGLLAAENRSQPATLVVVAHRAACFAFPVEMGTLPRVGYARLAEISKREALSEIETSVTSLGEHPVWAMRSRIQPSDPRDPMRYSALLLLPVEQGIVEFILQAQSRASLDEMMGMQLHFEDGAGMKLFPTSFTQHGSARK